MKIIKQFQLLEGYRFHRIVRQVLEKQGLNQGRVAKLYAKTTGFTTAIFNVRFNPASL